MITIRMAVVCAIFLLMLGCEKKTENIADGHFSELALEGKALFAAEKCGVCHKMNTERHRDAPDLTHPFLANDSMFVQTHLQFVERSEMPPIDLSGDQIRALAAYIAELHVAMQPEIPEALVDAQCPVCKAPVSTTRAKEAGLTATYFDKTYYFECKKCMGAFRHVPEAFAASPEASDSTTGKW